MRHHSFAHRIPGIVISLLAVSAAVTTITGGPVVFLWAATVAGLTLVFASQFSESLSFAGAVVAFLALELLLLHATPYLGSGAHLLEEIVWSIISVASGLLSALRPGSMRLLSARDALIVGAMTTGPLVLVGVTSLAQVLPQAQHLAWAMNNDAVNVVGFARRMIVDRGIDPDSTIQATPLPFAMVASNMTPGRSGLAQTLIMTHDITRLAETWVFVVAFGCALTGAIVARAVKGLSTRLSVILVAGASMIGLSWYVVGVQFEGGFINSGFAVVVLLAIWLAYSDSEHQPAAALIAITLGSTVLLGVWSPLIVCSIGLGLTLLVRWIRSGSPTWLSLSRLVPLVLAAVLFVGYGLLFTLRDIAASPGALSSNGGFPDIGPASIFVITAITVAVASGVAAMGTFRHGPVGAIVLVVSFAVGLGYLLLQRRGAVNLWGYYPAKYSWTVSILLIVVFASLAIAGLASRPLVRSPWRIAAVLCGGLVITSVLWSPGGSAKPLTEVPLVGIIRGDAFGIDNAQADAVLSLEGTSPGHSVVWRTAEGDSWANYWLLQLDFAPTSPIRAFSTHAGVFSAVEMCKLIGFLGPKAVVQSPDPAAADDLSATCPDASYRLITSD